MTAVGVPEALGALVLEAAHEGICTVDVMGNVTYANARMGAMLGTPPDRLVGQSIFDALAPGEAFDTRSGFARRRQGISEVQELKLRRSDGSTLWVRVAAASLADEHGTFIGAVYLASDVTAEREAKEQLARSERYFRALVERAADLIAVLAANGTIMYATPAWTTLLGYTPDEVVGLDAMQLIHPEDLCAVRSTLVQLMADPDATATAEYRALHRDGTVRVLHSVAHNLLDDPAVRGVVVNSHDVTEQRLAEGLRRHQTELLERIFGNIPAMITLFTPDGRPNYANAEWERVTGWSRDDRPDAFTRLFATAAEREETRAFIQAAIPGVWRDCRLQTRDGHARETTWTNVRLSDGSVVCFGRDVTEERRLGAQLRQAQKMEAVGQLTAGIAHDFNNLLQVISGNAYFARECVSSDSTAFEDIAQIQSAAERAAALTRQLLAFSRQQVLRLEPVELTSVVAEMESLLERTLGEDIALATQLHDEIVVNADRNQLEQVIMNLAVNARDAMPDGGVLMIETQQVELSAQDLVDRPGLEPGTYAALVVRDTGVGMDVATRTRIFEPFFTTKAVGLGTGLGLSTVHGIVHQSGGSVAVESTPGCGSVFTVYLPCVHSSHEPSIPAPSPAPSHGVETILLAEDDAAVRATVRRLLEQAGYTVIEAIDGRDAIDRVVHAGADALDLLLTDAVMPGAGARDIISATLRARPSLAILVMSGHSAEVVERRGELGNGVEVLAKPFTPTELLRRVRAALDARKPGGRV